MRRPRAHAKEAERRFQQAQREPTPVASAPRARYESLAPPALLCAPSERQRPVTRLALYLFRDSKLVKESGVETRCTNLRVYVS